MPLVYKDRSWCSQSHLCSNEDCYRNYTDAEHKKNTEGVDLPLSWMNFATPECERTESKVHNPEKST